MKDEELKTPVESFRIELANQNIGLEPAATATVDIPVASTDNLIDRETLDKNVGKKRKSSQHLAGTSDLGTLMHIIKANIGTGVLGKFLYEFII